MASRNNSDLETFIEQVNGESHLRIETDFGDGFVRLRTSEAERRQAAQDIKCSEDIVIELLRNARDAHAAHIFLATTKDAHIRKIVVIDDGVGIPEKMHERIFEPRVTSKLDTSHMDKWGLHGRGMALYSISENAQTSKVVASKPDLGSSILVETDTAKLKEKTDQSSFPKFYLTGEKTVSVRGPRNITRTVCEFALEANAECEVYLGTPSEIAATLYAYSKATLSNIERLFTKDVSALPLVKRLAVAHDPEEFAEFSSKLGLELSSRTARRVLNGSIEPLDSILSQIDIENDIAATGEAKKKNAKKPSTKTSVKLSDEDKKQIACAALRGFGEVAEAYYLDADVKPRYSVKGNELHISIPLVEKLDRN